MKINVTAEPIGMMFGRWCY